MTTHTTHRNGEAITLALGDRLISEDGATAVELTETGLAPMIFLGRGYSRNGDRWLMLHERRTTVDSAFVAADQACEIWLDHGGKPDFNVEVVIGGRVVI